MNTKELVQKMTLEEKASMVSGADFWHTDAVERLGIPAYMMSDGPYGLRKQEASADHLGFNKSVTAVCFPSGAGLANTFDAESAETLGDALGKVCCEQGVSVILGPAINMKRSPLCGRNFEYMSEDPYLAGKMATAYTKGVQKNDVGVSVKHFAANNQEKRRMSVSVETTERTLRETYLSAFEAVVKGAKPWTVMCSYNKIGGVYSSENPWFLTDVLRKEWGFDGYVVSDWGAVNDRVKGVAAGLDLEMPGGSHRNTEKLVQAVKDGLLPESVLDTAVERLLRVNSRSGGNAAKNVHTSMEENHALAGKLAEKCAVLLKNDGILPLHETQKVAFIGEFAAAPRYQGGGSSHINSYKVTGALDAATGVHYAQGFHINSEDEDVALTQEAVALAKQCDVAVVFAGLPDEYESEGYDRAHLNLPAVQNQLIAAVAAVQPNTVVVLHNGSPVAMPWLPQVRAVLEMYLGGENVGSATVNLLYGKANPSGKLAETFPLRLEDTPCYLDFPGEGDTVRYTEGVFIGYRWYDARKMPVLFPFGHGLSYTTYTYSHLRLSKTEMKDTDTVTATVTVKNTGAMAGREVVQFYVGNAPCSVNRPVKELRGFASVMLQPGEEKDVSVTLEKRAFAYYNETLHDWFVPEGEYTVMAAASCADIRLAQKLTVHSTATIPLAVTMDTTVGDILQVPALKAVLGDVLAAAVAQQGDSSALGNTRILEAMMMDIPLHTINLFMGDSPMDVDGLLQKLQAVKQG